MERHIPAKRDVSVCMSPDPPSKSKANTVKTNTSRKGQGDAMDPSNKSSHTQYYKKKNYEPETFKRVTRDDFYGDMDAISGSSDSFQCPHISREKMYTAEVLLEKSLVKNLDSKHVDPEWVRSCLPTSSKSSDLVKELVFLISDPTGCIQVQRINDLLKDYCKISDEGYIISDLDGTCVVMEYLMRIRYSDATVRSFLELMLQNILKPVRLNLTSDCITYFESLQSYFMYLGYLLMCLEEDSYFKVVSQAVLWHLSVPDALRGKGAVKLHQTLDAAAPSLVQVSSRMLAVARKQRFLTFLQISLMLGLDSTDNCICMMKEHILENIFYRFNPYYPDHKLPSYDVNPLNPSDSIVKLGDSSINMSTTLSLLLVLVATTKKYVAENPKVALLLPCPDDCSQKCFIWAYRYECRAPQHHHERNTLTVIVNGLLHCFGDRLAIFCNVLMADVMSLSVLTDVPPRTDWISTVPFNTQTKDVTFKKLLIYLSIDFLSIYPANSSVTEYRHWILGLMFLLDPALCQLRAKWSPSHFSELRKTSLQALAFALPLCPARLVKEYGLIRRLLWYIEWYSEKPYELQVLYWCIRLLQVAMCQRMTLCREISVKNLLDTHGAIILMHLCKTLMAQKNVPVARSQAIIGLTLRLLTSAVKVHIRLRCCVYPGITWPASVNTLAGNMLNVVLTSLENNYIISERWLIPLLNFIWQAIIWRKDFRALFIDNNGIYKLLDLITMVKPAVQCVALALICDVARAGEATGHLVTWRAKLGASNANPVLVKRGSTIAALLAAVFRDECRSIGVRLSDMGVIEDLSGPLLAFEVRQEMSSSSFQCGASGRTAVTLAAAEMAGSRMSKAFTILHLLSEDLEFKVSLLDETYKLYKNVELSAEDEVCLVLCSHYLTLKLNEAWSEVDIQCPKLLPQDADTLTEFLEIGKGWAKDIQRQQEAVLENRKKKDIEAENSLYAFLARVRLNSALDALRDVRCFARASDRTALTHALLFDAVRALQHRAHMTEKLGSPIIRTYEPQLDDMNITGQHIKVIDTFLKHKNPAEVVFTPTSQECKDCKELNVKAPSRDEIKP